MDHALLPAKNAISINRCPTSVGTYVSDIVRNQIRDSEEYVYRPTFHEHHHDATVPGASSGWTSVLHISVDAPQSNDDQPNDYEVACHGCVDHGYPRTLILSVEVVIPSPYDPYCLENHQRNPSTELSQQQQCGQGDNTGIPPCLLGQRLRFCRRLTAYQIIHSRQVMVQSATRT